MTEVTCVINGCDRPARVLNRTLCTTHYGRTRTGQPLDAPVRAINRERGTCSADGCEKLDVGSHGYCNAHIIRIRRHGSAKERAYRETDHPRWSGENATYSAVHQRVRKAKGAPTAQQCIDCDRRAAHWSYTHEDPKEMHSDMGPYSTDLDHYVPRCVRCHKRFDLDTKAAS